MISFQDAFTNSTLDVVVVDTSVPFPYDYDTQGDDWLKILESTDTERSVAFFGESVRKPDLRLTHPEALRRKAGILPGCVPDGFQYRHSKSRFCE